MGSFYPYPLLIFRCRERHQENTSIKGTLDCQESNYGVTRCFLATVCHQRQSLLNMHGWLTYSLDPSVASSHLHKYGFCFSLILNTFQEKFIKFNLYSMPINLAKASKCDHTVFTVLTFSTQSVSNIHCIFLRLWLEHFCNLVCQEMGEKIFPISLYPFPYSTNHHLHCQFINQSDYLKAKLNQFKKKTLINFEDKIYITVLFIFGFQFVGLMFSRGHTAVSSLGHG